MVGSILVDESSELLMFQFLLSNVLGVKKLGVLDDRDDQIGVNLGCRLNNKLFGEGEERVDFLLNFPFATHSRWTRLLGGLRFWC